MDLLLQVVINGLLLGGLYALMALGLALVWGVLNIVNLAHGALIMLGGYAAYYLFTLMGIDPFLSLPLVMIMLFVLGFVLQRYVLSLIARSPMFNTLLITFGLDVIFMVLAQLLFTADFRTINPSYAGSHVTWAGLTFPQVQLYSFAVALLLTVGLWLLLLHTRIGRAIRATAQNLSAARLYGVNPKHIYALTFGIGSALAGAAGDLYGVVSQITPYIGATLTAKCFAIAIIGGLENPLGVIVGGVLLALIESLTALYIGPTFIDVASFGVLVLVLIIRPQGLLGKTAK
ncbi:MAG: branched-chain amino acid ABC transporter permease [Betaproteobacteria bacterium]|nr:branched-chain amino acid ABC transporter permease [Betaproteobacteria bacterium]